MNFNFKIIVITVVATIPLIGCEKWNQKNLNHWEQGKPGAASWKANDDRDVQDHILEIEATPTHLPIHDADYIKSSYNAVSASAHPPAGKLEVFNPNRAVLYSTTVNLNDYTNTSNFGRLHGQLFATALVQHWQNDVLKMTLRQSSTPIVPQKGEFLLSRDIQDLAVDFNAGAVLVSTYSVSVDKVYLNLELINVDYNTVVAATSYQIPLGPRTIGMLDNIEIPNEEFLQ